MIVYRHRRLDNNQIFYVGIGKQDKRAYSEFSRNPFWKNVVAKTKYNVEIIARPETWEDCCELEQLLILEYGRADLGTGTLVNLTSGGEGVVGNVLSNEVKQKLRVAFKGRKHSNETKAKMKIAQQNMSEETKLKISQGKKGKTSNRKGVKLSKETIEKMRISKKIYWENKRKTYENN